MTSLRKSMLFGLLASLFAITALWAQDKSNDQIIRVGGSVQHPNLVSQPVPAYPAEAKRDRIQGTVQLQVIIDKEGHVAEVSVLGGPDPLIAAAVDAVRQWVYKPTLLNGEPVRVQTTVDVNFTLAQ
jgi:protein TonB